MKTFKMFEIPSKMDFKTLFLKKNVSKELSTKKLATHNSQ